MGKGIKATFNKIKRGRFGCPGCSPNPVCDAYWKDYHEPHDLGTTCGTAGTFPAAE